MKIKTTKQMRLDELLKYAWDNEIDLGSVVSDDGRKKIDLYSEGVSFEQLDKDRVMRCHTFAVPTEEELTEETEFDGFVVLTEANLIRPFNNIHTIGEVRAMLDSYETAKEIHAIANNKLTLIWTKDTGIPTEGVIEV